MSPGHSLKSSTDNPDPIFVFGAVAPPPVPGTAGPVAPSSGDFDNSLQTAAHKQTGASRPKSSGSNQEAPPNPAGDTRGPGAQGARDRDVPPSGTGEISKLETNPGREAQPGAARVSSPDSRGQEAKASAMAALGDALQHSGAGQRSPQAQGKLRDVMAKLAQAEPGAQERPRPAGAHQVPEQAKPRPATLPVATDPVSKDPPTPPSRSSGGTSPQPAPDKSPGLSPAPGPEARFGATGVKPADPQAVAIEGQAARALAQVQHAAAAASASGVAGSRKPDASLNRGKPVSGTNGAKSTQTMQGSDQSSHERPPAMQTLPGRGQPLPSHPPLGAVPGGREGFPARDPSAFDSSSLQGTFSIHDPSAQRMAGSVPAEGLRPAGGPLATLNLIDELQLRISNGAMELRAARADSMSVILRPDGRTEMTLHLKMHNGLVEVEARMQRGDFGNFQAQWSQLQQNLAQQGVRLHALLPQEPPAQAGSGQESANQDSQARQQRQQQENSTPFQDRPRPSEQDASRQQRSGSAPGTRSNSPEPSHGRHGFTPSREGLDYGAVRGFWESWA